MGDVPEIQMGKGVLVLTYSCNLKCSFCYAGVEVFDQPKSMSLAEAKRGVDFMEMLGIDTFTLLGGEPTVYGKLADLVAYAAGKGIGPWIVTNGMRLADPDYGQRLVDAGLKGGCISIHGHSAAEHDAGTQVPGSFDRAMAATRLAAERSWPIYPMLTVMNANLPNVMRVVDELRALGSTTIYINYGVPNVIEELDTGAAAGPEALARLSEQLYAQMDELGVRFVFNREKNKVPLCHFDHDTFQDMLADEVIGTGCEAVQGNTVVIEPGGTVLGCSHWVDHPLVNIYEDYSKLELISREQFFALWNTGPAREYRDMLGYFPYDKCESCGWRTSGRCYGGCKVWQSAGVIPKRLRFEDDGAVTRWGRDDDDGDGRRRIPVRAE